MFTLFFFVYFSCLPKYIFLYIIPMKCAYRPDEIRISSR